MNMLKYAYTILYVEDVNLTVDFYERAFGFERELLTPEEGYREIKSGETTIAFASVTLTESNR